MPNVKKSSKVIIFLCNNVDINGFKYIVDGEINLTIRILWISFHFISFVVMIFLVTNLWSSFMENPTMTSLKSSKFPLDQVPFPGISICSLNKISKRKAIEFAHYLSNFTKEDPDSMLQRVKLLGQIYNFDASEPQKLVEFQTILDTLELNTRIILRDLMTPCGELLVKCEWNGEVVNCPDYFEFTLTFEGYCCVFNYLKDTNYFGTEIKYNIANADVEYQKYGGIENGLRVVIRNDLADYFFTSLATTGIKIHIFMPNDFPDLNSGSLTDMLIGVGTESFINLEPTVFKTDDGVMKYSLNKRQCLFEEEKKTLFGAYSESDCLIDCRIKNILNLCNCVPFMMPVSKEYVCNLTNLACLSKHIGLWTHLAPSVSVGDELSEELEKGLHCDYRCYPACESTLYKLVVNHPKLHIQPKGSDIKLTDTIVHINFIRNFGTIYWQTEVYLWFEILSNFGGIFSLVAGVSIISVVQVGFFGIYYIYLLITYHEH